MQCLVRIAIAKYVHAGEGTRRGRAQTEKISDVSEALETLLTKDIAPNLPAEANVVPDTLRRGRLYTHVVHESLERSEAPLRAIYDFYAAVSEDDDANAQPIVSGAEIFSRQLAISMEEWFTLLEDARILDPDNDAEHAAFGRREAVLAFVWSQPFITDEIKRREKMQHLTFTDFVEALARVTAFLPLPSPEVLKANGARSCAHFFLQEEQGKHEGRKLCRKPFDWREDRVPEAANAAHALRQPLEMLISLLFERLSATGDKLTRADLKSRLAAKIEAKREAAEEERRAKEEAKTEKMFGGITDVLAGAAGGRRADMS
jgi:hypothetical protein